MDRRDFLLGAIALSILQTSSANTFSRKDIQTMIIEDSSTYLFGNSLTSAVNYLSRHNTLDGFKIPQNFIDDEMDLSIEVYKSKIPFLRVFQTYKSNQILLLEDEVALGRKGRSTPSGEFYLRRIIENPWWYPPSWADTNKPSRPGKNNPYGLWMSELSRENAQGDHDFSVSRDSNIRIHSTNSPDSIGKYASHGCIRLHPNTAAELFPAFLYYTPHQDPKKNSRGKIYPLEKTIKLSIS
ncbi:hypothetical protein COU57_03905 [Candidatus Pacearchaeota archaeon CG10_big_fil_rev_8_21_14_0_10_32_14]|nr:MAG: hypothetical protein COU57_03905 [Candidatus Pacearchaeota archaeon CG10_big_fil_rev_8_21_14_0_10_32_14]